MALNPYLHPRNPYRKRPDFKDMAVKDLQFRSVAKTELDGKVSIDFTDRNAVRVLTEALLRLDMGLNVTIPAGSLVPTLPLRFNYLLWIEDILAANGVVAEDNAVGFDVGVGPACIYPILAVARLRFKAMIGSEINADSLKSAVENVSANGLQEKIRLFPASADSAIFADAIAQCPTAFHFSMCNPPFYDDHDHDHGHGDNEHASESKAAGQPHEMNVRGGEVEFVARMIKESASVPSACMVFTCMIGHKTSLKSLKKILYEMKGVRFAATEFCQGRTMRWGLAWAFRDDVVLDCSPSLLKKKQEEKRMHAPMAFQLEPPKTLADAADCVAMFNILEEWLKEIEAKVKKGHAEKDKASFTFKTLIQGWKNQRRKRREKKRTEDDCSEPVAKRVRVDENEMEVEAPAKVEEKKVPVQLCCKVILTSTAGGGFAIEMSLIDGEAGKEGMHQLIQYLKNKSRGV